MYFDTMHKW